MTSKPVDDQSREYGPKAFVENGRELNIKATVRFDDSCHNGHNSFSITGEIYRTGLEYSPEKCGMIHEDVIQHFPELADLVKWHMASTDGPWGYPENPIYFAGDKDCWGKRKGEAKEWNTFVKFGDNPILHAPGGTHCAFIDWLADCQGKGLDPDNPFDFEVIRIDHDDRNRGSNYKFGPKFTFGGYASKWHECPFDEEREAMNFLYALNRCDPVFVRVATAWGEGKAPDLEAARRAALWPDATLEQLTDKDALMERLPALIADFKSDVEALGFTW